MQIELDTVADGIYGDTGESAGAKITEGYKVTFTVVTENGPGGGHPVIRYEGDEAELWRMVATHYGPDTVLDYFPAIADRATRVRHIIESGSSANRAGITAQVWAIVDCWTRELEQS